jgi:hypothetical protein
MRIHLVIFLLLCTPSIINQTYWHRLLLLFLADATDIVMIEAEKPQTQLKDQTKLKDGEKSKQVQIGLFADRMVTTYVGSYFPKLEERWQKAYESGGMNRHGRKEFLKFTYDYFKNFILNFLKIYIWIYLNFLLFLCRI